MDDVALCASFCETARPQARAAELDELLESTCRNAGFPRCERLYAGSYFCERYFCALGPQLHQAMRELCRAYDMTATFVIPIVGQAFLREAASLVERTLVDFEDVYDEVVVNDIACFHDLNGRIPQRIGLGRLFSKAMRDARYPEVAGRTARPSLSAEALECACSLEGADASREARLNPPFHVGTRSCASACPGGRRAGARRYGEVRIKTRFPGEMMHDSNSAILRPEAEEPPQLGSPEIPRSARNDEHERFVRAFPSGRRPLIELDPVSAVVDVSGIRQLMPSAEIALHLPYCFATTGRACVAASIGADDGERFRVDRDCDLECLRLSQSHLTDEGARLVKHGRTFYFANPACQIAGAPSWRIIYTGALGRRAFIPPFP